MKLMTDGVIAQNNQTKQRNTYLFASNLFQEVAYGMMLDSQKYACLSFNSPLCSLFPSLLRR